MQLSQTPRPGTPRAPATFHPTRLPGQRTWPFPAAAAHHPQRADLMAQARRVIATSARAYLEAGAH